MFKPGDYVLTKEYGERRIVNVEEDIVEVDVNFLLKPVKYKKDQVTPLYKFKEGDILTLPLGMKGEIVKVAEDYIIFDVINHNPIKLFTKDIKLFQNLEQ